MRVVLGTQALVQHYLNQQIAEARSFRATIVEGNPKESQKQRKLANESEALVENVKVILSDQLRGLKVWTAPLRPNHGQSQLSFLKEKETSAFSNSIGGR